MIVAKMLTVRNNIKLYHFSTSVYSRHAATCAFVDKADELIDTFVETYSARYGKPQVGSVLSLELAVFTDAEALLYLENFATFLVTELPKSLNAKTDSDLLNVRDELLSLVHQTLYLFSFR